MRRAPTSPSWKGNLYLVNSTNNTIGMFSPTGGSAKESSMKLIGLRRWFPGQTPSRKSRTRRRAVWLQFRPALEGLEDRLLLATFLVTNTSNSGAGSLRQAILDSNVAAGPNRIEFNIAGSGVHTIAPTSALPTVTHPVTIDGTSQPTFGGTPLIELAGMNAGAGADGLKISAGSSAVEDLIINRFGGNGIFLPTPAAPAN
jgi:hypothetical protein